MFLGPLSSFVCSLDFLFFDVSRRSVNDANSSLNPCTKIESNETYGKIISGKVNVPVNPLTRNDFYMHSKEEMINSFEMTGLKIVKLQPLRIISMYSNKPLFISIQGAKKF